MIPLPSDPRFDPWRDCGVNLLAERDVTLAVPALPPGETPITGRVTLANQVLRGTLDADGKRLTRLTFPQSLYSLYGKSPKANSGNTYGYSWSDGFYRVAANSWAILMDLDFVCPPTATATHHAEKGWNIIYVVEPTARIILINCGFWNCDTAVRLGGHHSHAQGIEIGVKGRTPTSGFYGHYGLWVSGYKVAAEDVTIHVPYHHDRSIQSTRFSVTKGLRCAVNGRLDFHAWNALDENDDDNLTIDADMGTATDPFHSGGSSTNKPWTGDRTTFHNVRDKWGKPIATSRYPSFLKATIIPMPSAPPPPPPPTTWTPGARVKVNGTATANVRSQPSIGSTKLGTQPAGSQGVLVTGPYDDPASTVTYWQVNFDSGLDGYVGQDRLQLL